MVDDQNRILVDGFYDNVIEPTTGFRAAMETLPIDLDAFLANAGLTEMAPPAGRTYAERIMTHPTLNICGISGGYGGPGSKTIIPSTASAKIDMRLVPDQTPDDIWDKVFAHLAKHAPDVEVTRMRGGVLPSYTPVEHPLAEIVRRAVETGFGKRPIDIPIRGASLSNATWTTTLDTPSFFVPYGAPEQANHSPNENYRIARLWQGMATSAAVIAELAATPPAATA
jgi:acetylornithine deacetylase/succinyl-diaminopimelate desuccinylase-like protein